MLWTCLLLPSLPLDVYTRAQAPDDPARPLVVTTGGRTPRVVAANTAALAAGVHAGQLVSAALALTPDLVLRERDLPAEDAALAAVAGWATQFTPTVSLAAPDAVLAEIGGSRRLFGGLAPLTERLIAGARELGYAARLAIAPTPTAALLLARAAEPGHGEHVSEPRQRKHAAPAQTSGASFVVTDPVTLPRVLAPLPLAALDCDPAVLATLAGTGVTTFGAACKLPRAALARRVGPGFVALLDRALGRRDDPRLPFVSPPRYEGRLELPAAVESVEALAFAVNRLVGELAGWLLGRGLGVTALSLALAHERHVALRPAGAVTDRGAVAGAGAVTDGLTRARFALATPSREPPHLVAVLRERLARLELRAPVVAITLASEETVPLAGRNLGLLPGDVAVPTVPLLDRLRSRLGDDAVLQLAPHAEHRPERAWVVNAGNQPRSAPTSTAGRRHGAGPDLPPDAARDLPPPGPPRPLWLLAEPEPLGHRLEAGSPWILRDGPERIESGWWDGADVRRDYFVAESPRGEIVWIYRDHRYGSDGGDDGEWFLHGIFA